MIDRLDHLVGLGVTAIELLPSAEFATAFSWGYNPAHIFAIEQTYGGPTGLKRLVRAAHERGLAVLGDVAYNHFGPSDLDLWRFDGWSEHGKGGIYFFNDHRCQTPWGDTRPDYGRPEVVAYLRDNVRMWLEEYRLDGLRWEATGYIRNVYGGNDLAHDIPEGWRLIQSVTADQQARQPWKVQIGERGDDPRRGCRHPPLPLPARLRRGQVEIRPPHQNTVGHRWRTATAAAGVSGLRLHELGHSYASGLIASGCDVVTVQRALGHVSATTTLSTYSHL